MSGTPTVLQNTKIQYHPYGLLNSSWRITGAFSTINVGNGFPLTGFKVLASLPCRASCSC